MFEGIKAAQRGGFENVEDFLLAGDQFRQVAVTAIDGMHEQTHAVRVTRAGGSGVLLQKTAEALGIA